MILSELIKQLQWWEKIFSGGLPVHLHTITNAPVISKGKIIDIYCDKEKGGPVNKIIIFGGNRK